MPTITVGGLPGSGTTTASKLLSEKLRVRWVYAGQIFRDLARERKMSLAEFGRFCEAHPEVDRELDRRQVEILREGRVVLEGRLSGWMAHREGLEAFKVWLACPTDVRVARIANREGGDKALKKRETEQRELSEQIRYRTYYGIDLADTRIYNLVLSTERTPPEGVVAAILQGLRGFEE